MSKRKKLGGGIKRPVAPRAMQLLAAGTHDGIPYRVFASLGRITVNVYLWTDKHVQVQTNVEQYMKMTLEDVVVAAVKKAMEYVPADVTLPPVGRINPN